MRLRRRMTALVIGIAGCLAIAAPAAGKAPTHAVLEDAARILQEPAGKRVTLAWTLDTAARLPEPARAGLMRPAGLGVYVRVRGGAGAAPLTVAGRPADPASRGFPAGRYVAQLAVPAGGLSAIEIGVRGSWTARNRPPLHVESPIAISNDPFAGRTVEPAGDAGAGPPWGVLLAGVTGLAGLALLLGAARALSARRPVT